MGTRGWGASNNNGTVFHLGVGRARHPFITYPFGACNLKDSGSSLHLSFYLRLPEGIPGIP